MPLNAKALKVKGPITSPFSDAHEKWWELYDESDRRSLGRFSSERAAVVELERISRIAEVREQKPLRTSNSDLFDTASEQDN